jgi:putative ABC transport system permease protein
MFFTYLRRELRRRLRQAIFISVGLALGIGLVITVTAASDGLRDSQATILHSLYGVGTDLTVTRPPAKGSGQGTSFGFRQEVRDQVEANGETAPGTHISVNELTNTQYGTLAGNAVDTVARQRGVSAAVGGLSLVDVTVTGTVPAVRRGAGSISSNFTTSTFTVDGVDVTHPSLGPLGATTVSAGRRLTAADANADKAVLDSGYAKQHDRAVGDTIGVGGTGFTVVGIVDAPQGSDQPDVYIPLARAQHLGKTGSTALTGKVNTVYVSAASAAGIPSVQREIGAALPHATITSQDDLAGEVTGSLANASSLVNNLGTWLSSAVLVAAFLLASLLTLSAVARRVREFGTLKALGWRSSRIVGQLMGESLVIGVAGGAIGVALGYAGAALIEAFAPPLSATVGASNAASASSAGGTGDLGRALTGTGHTVSVVMTAPVTANIVAVAVVLAVAGGLIAGTVGGWRAARLRPATALSRVE